MRTLGLVRRLYVRLARFRQQIDRTRRARARDRFNAGMNLQTVTLPGVSALEQAVSGEMKSYVGFAQKKLFFAQYCVYRLERYEQSIPNEDTQLWGASVPLDTYTVAGLGFAWSVLDTLAVVISEVHGLGIQRGTATFARIAKNADPALLTWRETTDSGRIVAAFIQGPQGMHLHELRTESYHHYISTAYEVQLTVGARPRYGSNLPQPGAPRVATEGLRAELALRAFIDAVTGLVDDLCLALTTEISKRQTID